VKITPLNTDALLVVEVVEALLIPAVDDELAAVIEVLALGDELTNEKKLSVLPELLPAPKAKPAPLPEPAPGAVTDANRL
jgi:hypothetical protein